MFKRNKFNPDWDLKAPHNPHLWFTGHPTLGLSAWLEKIVEMTSKYDGPWNVLIADLWPNDEASRLIGHVQMDNVSVGYDTGYRVVVHLSDESMSHNQGDDRTIIEKWLREAVQIPQTQAMLRAKFKQNPFQIRLTHWGYNPIIEATQIRF